MNKPNKDNRPLINLSDSNTQLALDALLVLTSAQINRLIKAVIQ